MSYIDKLFNLKGKIAIVIGSGGHLCSEISKGLYLSGVQLILLDIRKEKNDVLIKSLKNYGKRKIYNFKFDANEEADYKILLKFVKKNFNSIDILINGAGINTPKNITEIDTNEWNEVIQSHINTTFLSCKYFGGFMMKKKKGSIINFSSASAGPPLSKAFPYSVGKAGVKNLTQNIAREWAKYNVRVNCIRPGFFPTKWNIKNFIDESRKKNILGHTPMNRFGKTHELIAPILLLASDASSFITGSELTVDGGFSSMTI